MQGFVDIGWSIKPGDKFFEGADIGMDDLLYSPHRKATAHETDASQSTNTKDEEHRMMTKPAVQSATAPKAVIYCRVSTPGQQKDGHGLESQETRCRQFAHQRGYDVAAVFPDTMSGGGDFVKRRAWSRF